MAFYFKDYIGNFPGEHFMYGNANHALWDIMVWLQKNRPKEDPNIVMPVYIPAKLYRVALATGYKVKFYEIFGNCQFDFNEVANLIDANTQAVMGVHYFGIPGELQELKNITEESGVYLIEDCAHTLCTQYKGDELGAVGDCSIFSVRKMLQLSEGGFLVINNQPWEFNPTYNKRVSSLYTLYNFLKTRTKYAYSYISQGTDPLDLAWIPNTGYIDYEEEQQIYLQNISRLSEWYTKMIDLERVVTKRRKNYTYLRNQIQSIQGLEIVDNPGRKVNKTKTNYFQNSQFTEDLIDFTPYSFPVLISNGLRAHLRENLRKAGIGCGAGWPESPFKFRHFKGTSTLASKLLELPIHQGINKFQLDQMVKCLKEFEYRKQEVPKITTFELT